MTIARHLLAKDAERGQHVYIGPPHVLYGTVTEVATTRAGRIHLVLSNLFDIHLDPDAELWEL